jgi:predicted P-loop ATPase
MIDAGEIDLRPDLDAAARPKPPPVPKTTVARPKSRRSKIEPATQSEDAADEDAADEIMPLDIADALAAIVTGKGSHNALVALCGKLASQGVPLSTAEAIILNAVDQRPEASRDDGWQKMRGDVGRTLRWAYDKFAESEARYAAVVASAPPPNGGNGSAPPPPPPPGTGPSGSPGTPPPQPGAGASPRALMRHRPPRYTGNIANVITCLLTAPQILGCAAFDQMALEVSLRQPLPGDTAFSGPRPWTDDDTSRLQDFLQRDCQMARVGRETVQQGVEHVARMYSFHPVKEFLAGTTWDGTPRLDTWLTRYLGVADSGYARATGRMWMIGLVARIVRPGCKFDYMLILEGLQGSLKSQVCVALCGPWVSDQSLDIRHDARAASQHLRNKWLVEVSELTFFRQADVENLKAFISRTHERYLPRYARNEVTEPRQCGFVGTTNQETYLHDATGGRRFWPHRTGAIDIGALTQDREQLWAEVVAAYHANEHWWPEQGFEAQTIKPEQEARYEVDSWAEPISKEVERIKAAAAKAQADWKLLPEPKPPRPVAQTTLMQVWQAALTDPNDPYHPVPSAVKFDRSAQIRVREILQFLGWHRGRMRHGIRWWEWP